MTTNPLILSLREKRATLKASVEGILDTCTREENRDLSETETDNLRDAKVAMEKLDARIEELSDIELRNAAASELAAKVDAVGATRDNASVHVTRDELVYRPDNERSFFRDVMIGGKDPRAMERLVRHQDAMDADAKLTRDVATTDAAGFVPPAYLVSQFAELAKAGRPVTNILPAQGGPTTNTMYIPKWTTQATTGFQGSENSGLTEGTIAATNVQIDVRTEGGIMDVSRQLLDLGQLPDGEIFRQLVADYSVKVEDMVLNSTTANNKGLTQVASEGNVIYDDSTPTVGEMQGKIGAAVSQIHNAIFKAPEVIIMDPTLWNWIRSRVDTTGRPLAPWTAPMNPVATFGQLGAEGVVGEFYGLPVVVSATLTTDSATPSDRQIIVARISESRFWESTPRLETFNDVGSAAATVRFRLFSYVAQTHARQPGALCLVRGSGTAITTASF